ncbi:hypothetical protein A4X13_0g8904 [Tilletia indica]|uniref:Uncharacterized protein n=1 Tax=Tilletia indica TaxID=43049 RepID=A0A8T8SD04_9BASI|nr:hypothetical protein A4X13_0g8904 [Tilletia indica]
MAFPHHRVQFACIAGAIHNIRLREDLNSYCPHQHCTFFSLPGDMEAHFEQCARPCGLAPDPFEAAANSVAAWAPVQTAVPGPVLAHNHNLDPEQVPRAPDTNWSAYIVRFASSSALPS